jgi:hypothetical protein
MTPLLVEAVPLAAVLAVGGTDAWVYVDAKSRDERGDPVAVSFGSVRIDTPLLWLACCLVLWIVAFPIYLAARGAAG